MIRTQKFISALAYAPTILSTRYVDDCLSQNRRLDPALYLLDDTEFEESSGFTISESLERAQANQKQLLRGYVIYCTEDIHGGYDTYNAIAVVNGGKCIPYRARPGASQVLRAKSAEDGSDTESKPADIYLLTGTTPHEAKLWPKFTQMVEAHGKIPRVVRYDWLLFTALSQKYVGCDGFALTENDVDD